MCVANHTARDWSCGALARDVPGDGTRFGMTFTGRKENGSWNTLRGEFVLR